MFREPIEAFPYKPPTKEILVRFEYIFQLEKPLKTRKLKRCFDILIGGFFTIISIPLIILLKTSYLIEGAINNESKGPLFFYYYAVTAGKKFKKWKIRLIKEKYINQELVKQGSWYAYCAEWSSNSRTLTGQFAKKFYIDEIPQFYSILKGDMSLIGPRPLAVHHYERDLAQGNVIRRLIKGGILGMGHIHKGTHEFGNPIYEYEYIDQYIKRSSISLMILDLSIIFKGIKVILKGGGH